jgi:AcrB/AcrD/AcrF family
MCMLAIAACGRRGVTARDHGPEITVTATSLGRTVLDMESQVANPIEGAIATAPQLAHIHTRIVAGTATITVELERDADRDAASRAIYERVRGIQAQLPTDVVPVVMHAPGPVVLRYALRSSTLSSTEVRTWQDSKARLALVRLAGIANVESCGGDREEIAIDIDADRLAATGVSLHDVILRIEAREHALPGIRDRLEPDGLRMVPIGGNLLSDIATIRSGAARRDCDAYDERGRIVLGSVRAQRGADPSEVRDTAERALGELTRPAAIALDVLPRTAPIALEVDAPERDLPAISSRLAHLEIEHLVVERAQTTILRLVPKPDASRDEVEAGALRLLDRWPVHTDGDVVIALSGPDLGELGKLADKLGSAAPAGDVAVERVEVDRVAAARAGIAPTDLSEALRAATDDGFEAASWFTHDRQVPVVIRCKATTLHGDNGVVPVSSIIRRVKVREPAEIAHEDRERWLGVRLRGDAATIRDAVDKLALPAGYRASVSAP